MLITEAGRRDAQREADRLRLLERIGQRLAGSLELDATLREVAQILVPRFGDHCFIDLFSGDKLIRRAAAHAGGWEPPAGTWAQVGEAIQYPPGHFMQQAMSRLETIVVPDLQADYYPAPSEQSLSAADQAGLTSVLAAPLYARGELLGGISLALSRLTDRPDPHYDISDGDLIGAIASRIAVAIDNAMLFEAERRTALAFQQSLLPHSKPDLDGLDVAFRYVPAKPLATQGQGIQTQVGGDWYDIIPLAAGRVGLVIGDVEGRGARAAATMGQLRAALRAYAQDEKSPADIMRKLDEWVRSTAPLGAGGDPPTVSCIYLIYDAWSRELTFANAGHAAPLMASGGTVRPLEVRHKGVLLGVRGRGIRGLPTYREQTVILPPGAALVLYTDGLTDRRSRADGDGHYTEAEAVEMLRRRAAHRPGVGRGARGGGGVRRAGRHRRRHGHPRLPLLPRRPGLVRAVLPGRADHGLRGPAPRRGYLRRLGDASRPGRPRPAAGLRGRDQRGAARLGHAEPAGPPLRPGTRPAADRRPAARRQRRRPHPGRAAWPWAPPTTPRSTGRASSPCGCAAGRRRSGWRSSTPTSGCPGCAPPGPPTRAAAASTWSSSWPPAGDRGPPPTARPSGSRSRWTTRPVAAFASATAVVSTRAETSAALRLDEFVSQPALRPGEACPSRTHGRGLWPWVAQVRLAPYSYDWIDNRGHRSPRKLALPEPGRGALPRSAAGRRPDPDGRPRPAADRQRHGRRHVLRTSPRRPTTAPGCGSRHSRSPRRTGRWVAPAARPIQATCVMARAAALPTTSGWPSGLPR